MARAYYNEFDPRAAAWLRELIAEGLIAPGDVDERSIVDVQPGDLKGYTQVHLFAGIGGWSLALRLGGWPDDEPVWTGSCPCQPFSAAGKRRGTDDERHLWPEFRRLVAECRPATAFGEQTASALGRAWLASVRADLEDLGYAVGAADLCSASVGAPHIRQRLWWVADASAGGRAHPRPVGEQARRAGPVRDGNARLLAHSGGPRLEVVGVEHARAERPAAERGGEAGGVGDAMRDGRQGAEPVDAPARGRRFADAGPAGGRVGLPDRAGRHQGQSPAAPARHGGAAGPNGRACPWDAVEWLPCRDGKARPTQPGLQPLAHGVSGRVGLLRGAGNAINPVLAAEFIAAFRDVTRPANDP